MACVLLVAHAPLASALQEVAQHAYAECGKQLAAVDVPPSARLSDAEELITRALEDLAGPEVLILTDAFGATPCNAALNVADGLLTRVVTGVNVPMLWRTLCYGGLPLAELVARAADGGRQGIMQLSVPRRQNQGSRPALDDPDANPDQ